MAKDSLLVNLCNTAPLALRRQVVILHDAAVAARPHNFRPAFRWWYQLLIRTYTRRAAKVATVSRFSAGEIAKHFGVALHDLEIIGELGETFCARRRTTACMPSTASSKTRTSSRQAAGRLARTSRAFFGLSQASRT